MGLLGERRSSRLGGCEDPVDVLPARDEMPDAELTLPRRVEGRVRISRKVVPPVKSQDQPTRQLEHHGRPTGKLSPDNPRRLKPKRPVKAHGSLEVGYPKRQDVNPRLHRHILDADRREIIMAAKRPGFRRSGPCRDRTCDLGIKSPLLYQLS
jgi:hypothetical protein